MIDIVQWRASIGSWNGCSLSSKLIYSHSATYVSNSTMLFVVLVNCHFLLYFLAEIAMILLRLAGDVETNPGPLTVNELNKALEKLTKWVDFAINLPGINFADASKITKDFNSVDTQKMGLFDLWLRRYPSASWTDVINALKIIGEDTIASDIETDSETVDNFTEVFKTAVNDRGSLSCHIAQCMPLGPPGVGKSCLYRLLDRKLQSEKTAVSESSNRSKSTKNAAGRKTVKLMLNSKSLEKSTSLVVVNRDKRNERAIYLRSTSMPTDMLSDTSINSRPLSPHSETDLDSIVIAASTQYVASKVDTNNIQTALNKSISIYYTDLHDQLEFHEVLPALVAGPTIFLLVFNLYEGLDCKYTVQYESSSQNCENYTSYFTVRQMLMRCLSSIVSYYRMCCTTQSAPTKVIIIGTHSDLVEQKKIQAIDAELQRSINNTILDTDELIEPYSSDLCLIPIDNYNADDGNVVRNVMKRVITREVGKVCPYKIETPVPWLSLQLSLQKQGCSTITYDECLNLARKFNITDEDFPHCLNFLHYKTGTIRYYSGIKELSNTIIINHGILFDAFNELIISTFSIANVGGRKSKIFKTLGLFKATDAQNIFEKHKEKLEISFDQFVALLKHLNILGLAHGLSTSNETFDYFLPCALVHAPDESNELFDHNSLLISFKSGFVPEGVFCGLLAFLSNREFIILRNLEGRPFLYRNQVTFEFSNENYIINIVMKVTAKLLVFRMKFNDEQQQHVSAYGNIRGNMRAILEEGMQTVSKTFKYCINWDWGLYCSHSTCKKKKVEDHFAKFDWSKSCLTCSLTGRNYRLADEPEIADWFTSFDPKQCVPLKLPSQNSIKKPFDEPDMNENAEEVASEKMIEENKQRIENCTKQKEYRGAQGIIFVVGMFGADGTAVDVDRVKTTFKNLNFAVHTLEDPTVVQIDCLVKAASKCTYPDQYKFLAFYYAGHGGKDEVGAFIVPFQLGHSNFTALRRAGPNNTTIESEKCQPNENFMLLHVDQYIIEPLKHLELTRLFFFDCCQTLQAGGISYSNPQTSKLQYVNSGEAIAFATSKGQTSIGNASIGGLWTHKLCEKLQDPEPIFSILQETADAVATERGEEQRPMNILSLDGKITLKQETYVLKDLDEKEEIGLRPDMKRELDPGVVSEGKHIEPPNQKRRSDNETTVHKDLDRKKEIRLRSDRKREHDPGVVSEGEHSELPSQKRKLDNVSATPTSDILQKRPLLNDAYCLLKKKSAKWSNIGRAFAVPYDYREGLRNDQSLSNEDRLEKVIYKWQEISYHTQVTWDEFIKVLQSDSLNFKDTAQEVLSFLEKNNKQFSRCGPLN